MSSPNENIGRIHKKAFVVCNLFLFILCLLSVIARFYIRLRIQKHISIDDGFLLFGTGCLIAAIILLFLYINTMYTAEALVIGLPNIDISPNFIEDAMWFHKMIIISLILTWWALMAVKLCFLFLFKKLVQGIRPMLVYWWIVTVFNIAVAFYGMGSYIAACPQFESLACGTGEIRRTTTKFAISQMVLDIVGDLMILFIPCGLIWKVKIRLAQKLALASCLCLTVVIMVCTVMRISGLSYYNTVDATWETFWQYVSASIGLTMTSVAAFRSLFISHQVSHRQHETSDFEFIWVLYAKIKQALRRTFSIQSWRTRTWYSKDNDTTRSSDANQGMDLGEIERGTITGLRTFIHQYQRTPVTASQVMYSQPGNEVDDYRTWPSPDKVLVSGAVDNRGRNQVPGNDGSGRHEKILGHKGSRNDKMLTRQESRQNYKVLAAHSSDEYDTTLARPKRVRSAPAHHGNRSVTTTGDSEFDGSGRWLRGSASGKMTPKTRVGMMSKLKCGGIVFSAGFKAERYREK